jgi:hypothetical protein
MAEEYKRKGQYWGLYIGDGASPEAWILVACLNNKGFKIANKVIDGTSDCGPDYLPGFPNSTVAGKGFLTISQPNVQSSKSMFIIAQTQVSKDWLIQPVDTPTTGDPSWSFTGFLSNFAQDFNTDAMAEFSFDIQVQGYITQDVF